MNNKKTLLTKIDVIKLLAQNIRNKNCSFITYIIIILGKNKGLETITEKYRFSFFNYYFAQTLFSYRLDNRCTYFRTNTFSL